MGAYIAYLVCIYMTTTLQSSLCDLFHCLCNRDFIVTQILVNRVKWLLPQLAVPQILKDCIMRFTKS